HHQTPPSAGPRRAWQRRGYRRLAPRWRPGQTTRYTRAHTPAKPPRTIAPAALAPKPARIGLADGYRVRWPARPALGDVPDPIRRLRRRWRFPMRNADAVR